MAKSRKPKSVPIQFGPLPVQAINAALGFELDPGDVIMSIGAQRHVQKQRPDEFSRCFPHVASVVTSPLYVRDDFKNDGKIELVSKPVGFPDWLLVAVSLQIAEDGFYHVASFYPISAKKLEKRKVSGHYQRLILI